EFLESEERNNGLYRGDEKGKAIADLVTAILQKENEKKKLGKEVLNLYKEINVIFDFSEKLGQTIAPAAIARVVLNEVGHLVHSDGAVVILWDESAAKLEPVATTGDVFFNLNKVNEGI